MTRTLGDPAPPEGRRAHGGWYSGLVPERLATHDLSFVRLTAAHAELDHAALMASSEYLRAWSDSDWPEDDFSVEQNRSELAWHDEEHAARIAFTYSLLDAAESRALGCVYVRPLRDMLGTRGVEPPAGPEWPGGDTPCVRGWVRRDEPKALERRFTGVITTWLTGPDWSFEDLWWTAASDDLRQLAALDALGWTRELRVPTACGRRDWVLRAPGPQPSD
jgi:hypothetical protein